MIRNRTLYGSITFGIAIISMLAFDYFLYLLEMPLLAVTGILTWVICIAVAMFRLRVLQNQHNTSSTLSVAASLQQQLQKVKSEVHFYRTIVLYLLAPMAVGFVMMLVATQATSMASAIELGLFILFSYWAHRHNQRYIAEDLQPVESELKKSIEAMK